MPPVYRNEGGVWVKNKLPSNPFWKLGCGTRKCDICRRWWIEQRSKERDDLFSFRPAVPECGRCALFFRKGRWRDDRPSYVLHETFDKLERAAVNCRSCRLFRQAIVLDCPTSDHLDAIKARQSPIWVLGREDGSELSVEFGSWFRSLRLELADSPRAIAHPKPLATTVLDIAPAMLETCVSNDSHSACSGFFTEQQKLPTRVIDVGSVDNHPFLFVTEGRIDRYCTLSYCWGSSSTGYNTTRDNFLARTKELPILSKTHSMPKTYHDAIVITRRLGVRYLWIDALCIIQDDAADWREESARMKDIYQNSYCTIAATGATNTDQGILSRRISRILDPEELSSGRDGDPASTHFGRHIIAPTPDKRRLISNARLNKRGWVLQEMLLSPRVLHFTAHCLYFECLKHTTSEVDIDRSLDEEDHPSEAKMKRAKSILSDKAGVDASRAHELWLDIVFHYSRKDLTVESDRLPAIAGVAAQLQHSLKDDYLAGLWRSHMLDGLQWMVAMNDIDKPHTVTRRPNVYVAPSWSWTSIVGPLSSAREGMGKCATHWDREEWESAFDFVDCQLDFVDPNNPFGQIKSGYLRVRARLRAAMLSPETTQGPSYDGLVLTCDAHELPFRRETQSAIRFDVLQDYASHESRENLFCIELYRCVQREPCPYDVSGLEARGASPYFYDRPLFHALVLEPTGVKGQFKRVGFAKLTTRGYFDNCEVTSVDII